MDHAGPYDGFTSSIFINETKYLNSDLPRDILATVTSDHTVLSINNLIKTTLTPITEFVDRAYFTPVGY